MNHSELGAQQDNYMRSFLLEVLRSLVDDREMIFIEVSPAEAFCTLRVRASRAALSIFVGSKGQMARAVRTLLAGSSAKLGRRYAVDFGAIEPVLRKATVTYSNQT